MANVVFDKISKSYGSIEVIRELSLSIEDGEFAVLLGHRDVVRPRFCA